MKKKNRIVIGAILLSFTTIVTLIAGDSNGEVARGNGEVILTDSCFKNEQSVTKCIKNLHPKIDLDSVVIANTLIKVLKAVTGGRGTLHTIEDEITLKNQKRFIIYADISEAKKPVTVNIANAVVSQNQTRLTVDIETKDIKDEILIKNSEGETLIHYTVTN